jgi:rhodanese-related sulfurtransferase
VAQQLLQMKFTQVEVLKGGWNGWLKGGYPTEPKK